MATYTPTKTLVSATPKIRLSDNVVLEWDIGFECSIDEDSENSLPAWSVSYGADINVESLGKQANQFTKAEIISLIPSIYDDIFSNQYEQANGINIPPPSESVDNSFDVDSLPES